MTDIFHEVEEDLRREKLNKLWARYGMAFLVCAVLAVAATAAVVYWRQYQQSQAMDLAQAFSDAERKIQANDVEGGVAALTSIANRGGEGYPTLARFRVASLLALKGDLAGAMHAYETLLSSGIDDRLKALATIRAALTVIDTENPDALKQRVAGLTGDTSPWRFQAREIQAYADYRAGRVVDAGKAYAALEADEAAPTDLRARAAQLSSFIAGGAVLPPPPAEPASSLPTGKSGAEAAPVTPKTAN